jgi:7-cyano-7-deazaguanine synthase
MERKVLDLASLVAFFGHNSLTDPSVAVPEGPYSQTTIPVTTVPNRNMILLSVGIAWAVSLSFDAVAFGAHSGPRTNYPDCSPSFADAMDRAAQECDDRKISVLAPFVTWDKGDIVRRGAELGVPFALTWSCYKGGVKHCGQCRPAWLPLIIVSVIVAVPALNMPPPSPKRTLLLLTFAPVTAMVENESL